MQERITARTCVLLVVLVVLGVYYPAIFAPINSIDDPGTITYLLNTDSFNLRDIFTPGAVYFRPLLLLSFMADKYLWGLQESFMHLENVLFHLANALLVLAVARRVAARLEIASPLVPLAAALLFALHPINTESVNWISGRTDPLACIFILTSLFFLVKPAPAPRVAPLSSVLAALAILAACLVKETSIFFLPAALIFPFFLPGREGGRIPPREALLRNWPHLAVMFTTGLGFFAFRRIGSHSHDAGVARVVTHVAGHDSAGLAVSARLVFKAAGFYLKKLFVPFPLNFGIIHVSDLYLPVGVAVCLLGLWLLKRRTLTAYFFLCALAVGCSALLVPLLNLTWTPLAERYLYVPSAFFALGCVFGVEGLPFAGRHRTAVSVLFLVLLGIAVWGTATRTLLWQDNLALFRDTLKKSPGFVPAQNEIAIALYSRGETGKATRVLSSMETPASLINYQYGLITKATVQIRKGDLDAGQAILEEALAEPGKHEADIIRRLLAVYDLKIQKDKRLGATLYPKSVRLLARLYQITGDPFYQYRLGIVHLAQHEDALAGACFAVAAAKAPANAVYREPALKLAQKLAKRTSP
ncbi:hypothetical protein L4X63_17945 [Geomonas sp. Red32]|uniref:tetratricopeptide repeat protein n=1 Tax=Geomonas sp. Red32 TaxID=2912856 RepID=UPI00202CAB65|nr:hypothetical protein [Geomonas sp. Red32]MCM0083471.1 hypothetical protein [Geomonas sp. Red32]